MDSYAAPDSMARLLICEMIHLISAPLVTLSMLIVFGYGILNSQNFRSGTLRANSECSL